MRLPRQRRWLPKALVVFVLLFIYAAWPGSRTFTVSKETTYVTEPLDANGYVDYPKALNQKLSEGITPEKNANVLILKALGPRPEGTTELAPEFYEWLKIDPPPEIGQYAISATQFFKTHLKDPPIDIIGFYEEEPDRMQSWFDTVNRAQKWPWSAKDQPDVAKWLKQNEKPLVVIYEATKRPRYYNPLVAKNPEPLSFRVMNSLLPTAQRCRDLAMALSCRAMNRVAEGDFDGAWNDLMVCQRLGRLISHGGTLIESLAGIAVVQIAMNGQVTFLSHSKHSSKQLLAWQEDLRRLPPMASVASKVDLGDRFMILDVLNTVASRGPRALEKIDTYAGTTPIGDNFWQKLFTRSVNYDPAFKIANDYFDRCVATCRQPNRAARKHEMEKLIFEIKQVKLEATMVAFHEKVAMGKTDRGEWIGKVIVTTMLPAFSKVQDAADRTEQSEQNLQVAFALAAYRADHTNYPATLNELAPKYLAKIAGDMFSGQPLVYRLTDDGYLLYSVGLNGIDEEGRWRDDMPAGDDLRVRMPATEPVKKLEE